MKNLHHQFYDLREKAWKQLEELVHSGCDYIGDFPVDFGSILIDSASTNNKKKYIGDCDDIIIRGIIANPNYSIFPPNNNIKDIIVTTNEIEVILFDIFTNIKSTKMVKPALNNLQSLCTYLSGGYEAYEN